MCPEVVRNRLAASPFHPFELWLNSDQVVRVPHRDFAFMPPKPNQWDIVVYDENQALNIIDLGQVAALKEVRRAQGNGKGRTTK